MMDNNDISVGFMLGVSISDPELVSVAAPWHHLTIYSRHLVLCSRHKWQRSSRGALLAPPLTLLPALISHHHTIITISGDKQQSTIPRLNTNNFFSL